MQHIAPYRPVTDDGGGIGSVGRALTCRKGGLRFDSQHWINTQGPGCQAEIYRNIGLSHLKI